MIMWSLCDQPSLPYTWSCGAYVTLCSLETPVTGGQAFPIHDHVEPMWPAKPSLYMIMWNLCDPLLSRDACSRWPRLPYTWSCGTYVTLCSLETPVTGGQAFPIYKIMWSLCDPLFLMHTCNRWPSLPLYMIMWNLCDPLLLMHATGGRAFPYTWSCGTCVTLCSWCLQQVARPYT